MCDGGKGNTSYLRQTLKDAGKALKFESGEIDCRIPHPMRDEGDDRKQINTLDGVHTGKVGRNILENSKCGSRSNAGCSFDHFQNLRTFQVQSSVKTEKEFLGIFLWKCGRYPALFRQCFFFPGSLAGERCQITSE